MGFINHGVPESLVARWIFRVDIEYVGLVGMMLAAFKALIVWQRTTMLALLLVVF